MVIDYNTRYVALRLNQKLRKKSMLLADSLLRTVLYNNTVKGCDNSKALKKMSKTIN